MSFNRRRNIFTLGDFHLQHPHPVKAQLSKRQNSDPFERDPFKIQSYNFHYAERPSYPLSNLISRVSKQNTAVKPFETHYYNHDFSTARHDKENSTANKFHEFRRRKFLLNHQQTAPTQQRNTQYRQQHYSQELQDYQQEQQQQQHHQLHRSSIPTSTAATAGTTKGALRRTAARTTPIPATSLLRSGTDPECLQGLRTLHSTSTSSTSNFQLRQQQQGTFQNANSFARSSNSRVSLADSSTGHAGVRRLQKANTFISSYNSNNSNLNSRNPRVQNNRSPLQTIHVSSQNLVAKGSNSCTSGCQINIRIKGLDEKALADNVTIKIESESSPKKQTNKQQHLLLQQHQPQAPISPNILNTKFEATDQQQKDVERANSSDTIIINKRLSKFELSESSSNQNQIKPHCVEVNPLKSIRPELKERVPSMVPWVLNNDKRSCFNGSDSAPENPVATAHTSLLRRICNNYDAGLEDIKDLREKAKRSRAIPTLIANQKPMTTKLPAEHKLLNTITVKRKVEPLLPTQKFGVKQQRSHLSLRNIIDKRNQATSPDNCLNQCRSSASQFQRSNTAPLIYQTRRSLSPLNVNINVYADKLKLLRV